MAKSKHTPLSKFMTRSITLAKKRDADKGWVFDTRITADYLMGLYYGQQGLCCHTNESMTIVRGLVDGAVVPTLCTMERIDNTRGYEIGNVMLACDGINRMRGNMGLNAFRKLCKQIGLRA